MIKPLLIRLNRIAFNSTKLAIKSHALKNPRRFPENPSKISNRFPKNPSKIPNRFPENPSKIPRGFPENPSKIPRGPTKTPPKKALNFPVHRCFCLQAILTNLAQTTTEAEILLQFSEHVVGAVFPDILQVYGGYLKSFTTLEDSRSYNITLQLQENYVSFQVSQSSISWFTLNPKP